MHDSSVIDWLLEEENPSVRYFTQIELLGMDKHHPDVVESRRRIMSQGIVPTILAKQNPDGSWGDAACFYTDKYSGTSWTLLTLAQLGVDIEDPRIKKACEFMLNASQDPVDGGVSIETSQKTGRGLSRLVIPCLTGNMVYALIRLGYLHADRKRHAIRWILTHQRTDDGVKETPKGALDDRLSPCFGDHSCHMGVAKAMKALAAIPKQDRNEETSAKIGELAEYFLIHRLYKKSHDLDRVAKPGWLKFGFPLMYQTDVVELLEILIDLGIRDDRMNEALSLLESKQNEDGKWILENAYNGKIIVDIEEKGKPSKWITFKAMKVIKKYRESDLTSA
ncbi:MAG: hypothetical protein JXK92_02480 [Erysipelotrichaceae bacterium]|nr:hypothetical protein [Erysipelotrichaceae bacterium]